MNAQQKKLAVWLVLAIVALVVLQRVAGAFAGRGRSSGASDAVMYGRADTFPGMPGTVTAPSLSMTPTTHADIIQASDQPKPAATIGGQDFFTIPNTKYIGAAGAKAADIVVTDRVTPTSSGASIVSANVPGAKDPTITQGVTPADLAGYSNFHINDARVQQQIAFEAPRVDPSQKATVIGNRNDGTPFILYGRTN